VLRRTCRERTTNEGGVVGSFGPQGSVVSREKGKDLKSERKRPKYFQDIITKEKSSKQWKMEKKPGGIVRKAKEVNTKSIEQRGWG